MKERLKEKGRNPDWEPLMTALTALRAMRRVNGRADLAENSKWRLCRGPEETEKCGMRNGAFHPSAFILPPFFGGLESRAGGWCGGRCG